MRPTLEIHLVDRSITSLKVTSVSTFGDRAVDQFRDVAPCDTRALELSLVLIQDVLEPGRPACPGIDPALLESDNPAVGVGADPDDRILVDARARCPCLLDELILLRAGVH